ncbi:MAG: tRNA 4-thiouridine(8) synthase ThiI, partial [bacterium]
VKTAREWGIPLLEIDITDDILKLLKAPPHGFGSQMNPCIDCHALMLRKAKEIMEEVGASFVATGEVLGERPMSQNREALRIVEKESGLEGLLLRPLSAKLLPPTIPEKEGWVDREKLLDIKGRSRKRQLELAEKWGIKDYPFPAGGCLLTDPQFSKRLKDLLDNKELTKENVVLLKLGRHFRLRKGVKLVVGRNKDENERIREFAREGGILLRAYSHKGPDGLLRGDGFDEEDIELAGKIIARYSDIEGGEKMKIKIEGDGEKIIEVEKAEEEVVRKFMV